MGGRDTSRYTGDVVTVPVVKQGYWSINFDSVEVGGADLGGYLTGGGGRSLLKSLHHNQFLTSIQPSSTQAQASSKPP